jgi:putative ABC transport system ATP-binding protein
VNLIEIKALSKVYGQGQSAVHALRGVDVTIPPKQFVAVTGPSGSGKSTLLYILGTVDLPTEGRVLLDGSDLTGLSDRERTHLRRRRIGFVFQAFNLLPILTAAENVALPLVLDGVAPQEAARRAGEILERVGLSARTGHFPAQLSGGEQQRVAIARALVINPALILADEPTGNLDSASGAQVMDLLRRLVDRDGQSVVMVTHDHDLARRADRILGFLDGAVVADYWVNQTTADSTRNGQ